MKNKLKKLKDAYYAYCKGCYLYENDKYCTVRKSPHIINCPCQNCIIKMICNRSCDKFEKLRGIKIYEDYEDVLKGTNMNTNDCDCEGCLDLRNGSCNWFEETLICPCSICIIKVMCKNPCDLLDKHISKIKNHDEDK